MAAERQMRSTRIPELHVRPPRALAYLWEWFRDLSWGRPAGGMGPSPIPASEIVSWGDLSGLRPTPWEFGVLRALDRAVLAEKRKEKSHVD